MSSRDETTVVRKLWERLAGKLGGRTIFAWLLARTVPYVKSIRPQVIELGAGRAVVSMRDRRGVRNHLGSVHAGAIMTLAETASGFAMTFGLSKHVRAIVTRVAVEYLEKARGPLTATCDFPMPERDYAGELQIAVTVRDAAQQTVAHATATWLIGPVAGAGGAGRK